MSLHEDIRTQGYAGPVQILSENDRRILLLALRSGKEPPPLDWYKGHAATSRLFYDLAVHPGILDVVASVLGRNVLLWGASLVERAPGAVHPWHTDIESRHPEGGTVSVWIGLENTTPLSSIRVVPHSHTFGITVQEMAHRHQRRRRDITHADMERWASEFHPQARPKSLEIHDGEAVFFDGRLWHGSHNEDPAHTRLALLLQYTVPKNLIRMLDLKQFEWPFREFDHPLPPCLLLRGESDGTPNRIVPGPARVSPGGRARLGNGICRPALPMTPDPQSGWKPQLLFRGPTVDVPDLCCHVSVLACGTTPHPPHTHPEEEILLVLDGEVDVHLPALAGTVEGDRRRLRRGEFVYYPAHFPHTLQAVSSGGAHYLMFKWLAPPSTEGPPLPFGQYSARGRFTGTAQTRNGFAAERIMQGPTGWLRRLHCHVSLLEPGAGYPPHADAHDVAIVVLDGEVKSLGGKVGPNEVLFYASGEPHGISNPGNSPARYLVFEFHGSQNGFAGFAASRQRDQIPPGPASIQTPPAAPVVRTFYTLFGDLVRIALPESAHILVISKGDTELLARAGRNAAHFPQAADGTYLGYHPADGREVVGQLESMRERGAEFLVIPQPSMWWLEFYTEFRRHLDVHCPMVAFASEIGVIFALRPPAFRPRMPQA